MYLITLYVPETEAEKVKQALFDSGAGRIGNYSHCCFESSGLGQFLPLNGAHPAIGEIGAIQKVNELKIEMVCSEDLIKKAITALKNSHPYETPAYNVTKTLDY